MRQTFADAFETQLVINMGIAGAGLVFSICTWERHPTTFTQILERLENDEEVSAPASRAVA